MKITTELKTERLLLRPFDERDVGEIKRLAGERAIADTTTNIPHPYEDGMAEEWIAMQRVEHEKGTGITLAITSKDRGTLLGAISLLRMEKEHQAELGYWVGKPYWKNGYCTEAARALLTYALGELGLIRIHARHLTRNPASGRVMQKLGMKREGSRRKHTKKWGKYEDMELYGILKEEFNL